MKEKEKKKKCNCEPDCNCGCQEGKECTCDTECTCESTCNDECCKDGVCSFNPEEEENNKLNDAYNKISELEDKLIRQNADTINYRKRKEEEISKMLKFCNEDLIKELLPILDNFERAINTNNDITEEMEKFLSGFKMIYCSMQNIMEKYDVKMIDGANKPFDPVYHNAILTEKVEGMAPGEVIEVLQKGYLYKDKVIRTAMVRVSE